jgi:hypothetical protein
MAATVQPLDPDSDKGREVAERLNQVLAEICAEMDARDAAEKAHLPAERKAA